MLVSHPGEFARTARPILAEPRRDTSAKALALPYAHFRRARDALAHPLRISLARRSDRKSTCLCSA
jgi:hypothetical protein